MASESTLTIEDVPPEDVQQAEAYLISFLSTQYPSMDLSEGRVLRDLLIRPAATFHALNREDFDRLRRSMSLQEIEKDPALADEEMVNSVLSNYRVERYPGSKASGVIAIILSEAVTTSVEADTIFTSVSNGLTYVTDKTYVGVTDAASIISDEQRLIARRSDGTYSFTLPVTASDIGSDYAVKKNTRFTASVGVSGALDYVASSDFVGGVNKETNEELIQRFKLGISAPVLSGRTQIEAALKAAVPEIVATSIVGFGDAEMLRDRHNIFALSHGGKADLYVRAQLKPVLTSLIRSAVLIDSEQKIWQLSLDRDAFPGFYLIQSILPENSVDLEGTLEITAETRGLDLSSISGEFVPSIKTLTEGAYTRYQTAVVQFRDLTTDTAGLVNNVSTKNYQVQVNGLLNIKLLQDYVTNYGNRNPQADYLVRAPIPAFCALSVVVQYPANNAAPDVEALRQALANRINSLGFNVGKLPASVIFDEIYNVAGSRVVVVSPLDMFCQIRYPDGQVVTLRSANALVIPNQPQRGVTARTTVFFADPLGIDVRVEKLPTLTV